MESIASLVFFRGLLPHPDAARRWSPGHPGGPGLCRQSLRGQMGGESCSNSKEGRPQANISKTTVSSQRQRCRQRFAGLQVRLFVASFFAPLRRPRQGQHRRLDDPVHLQFRSSRFARITSSPKESRRYRLQHVENVLLWARRQQPRKFIAPGLGLVPA